MKTVESINEVQETLARVRKLIVEAKADHDRLVSELRDCRNELCLKCGQYKQRHLGACDGCRWRASDEYSG